MILKEEHWFNKKIVNQYGKKKILDKIETFIPQESIIGRIMEHKEKTTVSLSCEKGIFQHDIYDADTFGDMKNSLSTSALKILKTYTKINEEDRKAMTRMIKEFASSYINVIKERKIVKKI